MTAPFLSLAQILNRLALTARWILRDHQPTPCGRCPICHTADCAVATAARNVLEATRRMRWGDPVQQQAATDPAAPDHDEPRQAG
ncbi:hypothetical protein GA0070616_2810 [Micromonospora nigra]|uniref:Uncharacterized protein n=1 Tax=Micromonospora nigra TaxID=145857 RepID=A0A1C6S307_9ACTN|nr:hypothetical protein [Micromonospora nigra]SCL23880.1 hypothetical protein GA0070616_2810 [Micromonospora nigra]